MNFDESVSYLYSLGNEVLAMKLGLASTEKLLAALGNPEKNFLKIQVAGTNGKGSTCAFLEAVCQTAKINVGFYSSPHLISITERIRINGNNITEKKFAEHATKIKKISEKLVEKDELTAPPTFFEQVTAIAVSAFAQSKVDLAILETGLGGRFDSTTAARAEIIGITPIDFDHQNILGETLEKIAAEKAAVIRSDTKVVVAVQNPQAQRIIQKVCEKFSVTPNLTNFIEEIIGIDERNRFIVNFQTAKANYKNVHLNLLGRHQIENAKAAILLVETLQESGFKITTENIIKGLQTAQHKGRLEFWRDTKPTILFDGAHNAAGARALREFLDEFVKEKITLVFGSMGDKDLSEIAKILFPKAEAIIFTMPDNPRSMIAEDLLKFLPDIFEKQKVFLTPTVEQALKKAREISHETDLVCIAGSIYLVGEAQKVLRKSVHA